MTSFVVSSGFISTGIVLNNGDTLHVLSSGTANDTIINAGGSATISSGGFEGAATVNSSGFEDVFGSAFNTVISGGTQQVESGGRATGVTIDGGQQLVKSGGVVTGTILSSGGTETISSGGLDINAQISGGSQDVIGTVSGAQLASGFQAIELTGSAVSTTVSGGTEFVSGTDTGAMIFLGQQEIFASGTATSAIVEGGSQVVEASGTASNTVISGGVETVSFNGLDISATVSGGTQNVFGSARSATILGGSQVVELGGRAQDTIKFGGSAIIDSGGIALSPVISAGFVDLGVGGIVSGGISFASVSGGNLQIDAATPSGMPTNTISGFVPGDTFTLPNVLFDSAGQASVVNSGVTSNVLEIFENGSTYKLFLNPAESFAGLFFHLSPSGAGTLVTENNTPCFCRGTRILTERGERRVEDLAIGDRVVTVSGQLASIKWIGHRAYDGRFIAGNKTVLPIHITADAFGQGLPARDLYVSPEHALYLEGVLVAAALLVNGTTIVQAERVDRLEYFHIELAAHDIILAEGLPAESYVECDNRGTFHNAGEFARLYPNDERSSGRFCAPRVEEGAAVLDAIRATLVRRGIQANAA